MYSKGKKLTKSATSFNLKHWQIKSGTVKVLAQITGVPAGPMGRSDESPSVEIDGVPEYVLADNSIDPASLEHGGIDSGVEFVSAKTYSGDHVLVASDDEMVVVASAGQESFNNHGITINFNSDNHSSQGVLLPEGVSVPSKSSLIPGRSGVYFDRSSFRSDDVSYSFTHGDSSNGEEVADGVPADDASYRLLGN